MLFNSHSIPEGQHAFLSPSKYHWINYDDDKLVASYKSYSASVRGVELHKFAEEAIRLRIRLPRTRSALNLYVNDVISMRMDTEQVLYYSDNCYGTADAISFKKDTLRIFDFKSGVIPASMKQLETYAALFCLEYKKRPESIVIELRIYQGEEVLVYSPDSADISFIMERIIESDKVIDILKAEG